MKNTQVRRLVILIYIQDSTPTDRPCISFRDERETKIPLEGKSLRSCRGSENIYYTHTISLAVNFVFGSEHITSRMYSFLFFFFLCFFFFFSFCVRSSKDHFKTFLRFCRKSLICKIHALSEHNYNDSFFFSGEIDGKRLLKYDVYILFA